MDLENGENHLLVVIFLLRGPDLVKFILSEITKFSCNLIFLSMDVTFMEMFSGILQQDVPNHDVCLIRTFLFFLSKFSIFVYLPWLNLLSYVALQGEPIDRSKH